MTQISKNIVYYNNLYQVSNMKYTVYLIRHISTGQVLYVGKTDNFKRRAYQHLHLNTGTKEWLSSIGTGNVLIEEVAKFDNEVDALKYEDELILKYGTIENGYNKNRSGLIKSENPEKYKIEYNREYRQTNEHKEYQRNYQKYYHKTDKYKEYQLNYQKTEKSKNYMRNYKKTEKYKEIQREYRKTDKRKEYDRNYQRDRYHSKKLGISVAEYRKLKNDQDTTLEQNKKQPIQLTINF